MEFLLWHVYTFRCNRAMAIMKTRLAGAQKGFSLLKKKSDALTSRFRSILKKIIEVCIHSSATWKNLDDFGSLIETRINYQIQFYYHNSITHFTMVKITIAKLLCYGTITMVSWKLNMFQFYLMRVLKPLEY